MGVLAYGFWGVMPLYWPLLRPAGALEILGHRVVWSLTVIALLSTRRRGLGVLGALPRRKIQLLGVAAGLIGVNWAFFIWAVSHHHVVETALGYFLNPLMTVLLGVFVLGERLRRIQWFAVVLAAAAVALLTVDYGRLPWIALVLAGTFALYALVKKRAAVGALESLAVETLFLLLPAVGYLAWVESRGHGAFGEGAWSKRLLLVSSGPVTAVPLLCFAGAANRIPLSTVGLLQYIAPTLQLLCGVVVFHEAMPPSRWLGFSLVWVALALFVADTVLRRARVTRAAG